MLKTVRCLERKWLMSWAFLAELRGAVRHEHSSARREKYYHPPAIPSILPVRRQDEDTSRMHDRDPSTLSGVPLSR